MEERLWRGDCVKEANKWAYPMKPNRYLALLVLLTLLLTAAFALGEETQFYAVQDCGVAFYTENGLYGVVDADGTRLTDARFDGMLPFKDGYTLFWENEYTGCIDVKGQTILEPIYDWIYVERSRADEIFFLVCKDGVCGCLNTNGEVRIPFEWEEIQGFNDGYSVVIQNGLYGMIDDCGVVVCEPKWEHCRPFSDGLARVEGEEGSGFVDMQGNLLNDQLWAWCAEFSQGRAVVQENDLYGVIDTQGQLIVEPKWSMAAYGYADGMLAVCKEHRWGYIDLNGNIVILPIYQSAETFSCGLGRVQTNRQLYGYVNTAGKSAIEPQYLHANDFSEGVAAVEGLTGALLIRTDGQPVCEPIYEAYGRWCAGGLIAVQKDGLWGYMNLQGQVVIEPQFSEADVGFFDDFATVKFPGSYDAHYILKDGRLIR